MEEIENAPKAKEEIAQARACDTATPTTKCDVPPKEITLEEWIAATQSCCGVDNDG